MMSELSYASLGRLICWVFCCFALFMLYMPEPLNFYDPAVSSFAETCNVLLRSTVGYFQFILVVYGDYNVS